MLISMIFSLYTSRLVLQALGLEDFGIYSVVGGILIVMSFFNSAMTASTQRFLTYSIGEGNRDKIKEVFRTSLAIHLSISIIVLILSETIGLWFVNNKLNIPSNRLLAAIWVFHSSVFLFVLTILTVPYHATIIAHEKMKAFASIGIFEVLLKYVVAIGIPLFYGDKLVTYAILMLIAGVLIRVIYVVFCSFYLENTKGFILRWNRGLINDMGKFATWNLLGVGAGVAYNQGVNVLLNIVFGPAVNGARAISFQVQSAVNSFVTSFQTAVNPTITKLYAQDNLSQTNNLVLTSAKFSFYLLTFFVIPLVIETKFVLSVWLGSIPTYAVEFTKLILVDVLIGSISGPIQTLVQATGKIKVYQIIVSGILLLNLPISYICLRLQFEPQSTVIVSIFFTFITLLVRLIIVSRIGAFPSRKFISFAIIRPLLVAAISFCAVLPITLFYMESFGRLVSVTLLSSALIITLTYLFGLWKSERSFIYNSLLVIIKKYF